jgi:CMP-N-acetylneuraminic acid synthetase
LAGGRKETLASVKEIRRKSHPTVKTISAGCDLGTLTNEAVYVLNASIYGVTARWLRETKSHVYDYSLPLVMDEAHSVDIDTEQDFAIAETYLRLRHAVRPEVG